MNFSRTENLKLYFPPMSVPSPIKVTLYVIPTVTLVKTTPAPIPAEPKTQRTFDALAITMHA